MNDDSTDLDGGCMVTIAFGVLAFMLYRCIDSDMPQRWWIAAIIAIAMIAGIVALYVYGKKKNKRNKENKINIMETENRTEGLLTRALLQQTLAKLSLKYEFAEDQRFVVKYQGETLIINADDDDAFIQFFDPSWYDAPLNDIDNLAILYKAINEHNIQSSFTKIVYTIDKEDNEINLHTLCKTLWIDSIPNIEAYLQAILDSIMQSHLLFFKIMEEERRKDFARRQ